MASEKKIDSLIPASLLAHQTLTQTSCNGFSWINIGFYADQLVLL